MIDGSENNANRQLSFEVQSWHMLLKGAVILLRVCFTGKCSGYSVQLNPIITDTIKTSLLMGCLY